MGRSVGRGHLVLGEVLGICVQGCCVVLDNILLAYVPQGAEKAFKKGKVEGNKMDVDAFFRQVG